MTLLYDSVNNSNSKSLVLLSVVVQGSGCQDAPMRGVLWALLALVIPNAALATPIVAVFKIQDARPRSSKLSAKTLENLSDYLATLLAEGGDFKVVPKTGIQTALSELKESSYRECYDERCQIEVGKAVAAQKLVSTKIIKVGRRCIVAISMFNVREEATEKAASHKGRCDEASVTEGLEQVAAQLRDHNAASPGRDRDFGERPQVWNPKARGKRVIASFSSSPPGAVVLLDGDLLCQDTSSGCRRTITKGKHRVSMQMERYETEERSVYIQDGDQIRFELTPNFGVLQVSSAPEGLSVDVGGEVAGKTPLRDLQLEPGEHRVTIKDPCYYEKGRVVSIARGEDKQVDLQMIAREGAIDVVAEDEEGNAARAEIIVDGQSLGLTPDTVKVPVCARELVVKNDSGRYQARLSVEERSVQKVRAVLRTTRGKRRTTATAKTQAPTNHKLTLGVQGFFGILCPVQDEDGMCVGNFQGGGGAVSVEWPPSYFLRGGATAGVGVYSRSSVKVLSIPISLSALLAVPFGKGKGALNILLGGEGRYAYRTVLGGGDTQSDVTNHNLEVGGSMAMRFSLYDIGGGIYVPVAGGGRGIVVRIWIGLNFGILADDPPKTAQL